MQPTAPLPLLVCALLVCALLAGAAAPPAASAARAERGLWIGPIQLCRETAVSVVPGTDFGRRPIVTITLNPEWRERLERETARLVGKPMAVRLDGRAIIAPMVLEPITGGVLALSGASAQDAAAIRVAAGRPC